MPSKTNRPTDATLAAFATADFLTANRLPELRTEFGPQLEGAFFAPTEQLQKIKGVSEKAAHAFAEKRKKIEVAKVAESVAAAGARVLFLEDADYPSILRQIASPPVVLLVRGDASVLGGACIGVVGSRKITSSGRAAVTRFVPPLCGAGFCVVSGLARGVDAAAHRAALQAGGKTAAILGNGIDHIYPAEHTNLAKEIVENGGAVVSEFGPGVRADRFHFPRRNRILAGLCRGVLVAEAEQSSGSLITAGCALSEGREVFAVPGAPGTPGSRGTNQLIKKGEAQLTDDPNEILVALGSGEAAVNQAAPAGGHAKESGANNEAQRKILSVLGGAPITFDELIAHCELPSHELSTELTFLEMNGLVRRLGAHLVRC